MSDEESPFREKEPVEIFRRRRQRVLAELGDDAMVLPAAPILYRSADTDLPYRPDSELFYLTGLTEPGALLLLRGFADEGREMLFVRDRDPDAELWTGPRLGPDAAPERLGVEEAHPADELAERLPGLLHGARRVHFRLGQQREVERLVIEALQTARRKGPRKGLGPRGVLDPGEILDDLRLRKEPAEIEAIRRACRLTIQGFREAASSIAPERGEWEVKAAMEYAFRRRGADSPAFSTIVASGENACVLHYTSNRRRLVAGELVLVDAGAEADMYAGDVTRTFPVSGTYSVEQRAVYELVEAARRAAVERIRPGATVAQVHEAAVETLLGGLREMGVLSGDPDELKQQKAYRRYFPHRTSHWLGIDTHDPGDYVVEGRSRELEAGMVLTVEPGLYFGSREGEDDDRDPSELEAARPFRGIGVRIEDDVLVTDEGAEVLTAELPTEPDRVAGLVGGGPDGPGPTVRD